MATLKELTVYIEMGFFVSVAGGICREKSGAALRAAVSAAEADPRRHAMLSYSRYWLRAFERACNGGAGL